MANDIPKGKSPDITDGGADTIRNAKGKVNDLAEGTNSMGIPYGQTPGLGRGDKEVSRNQLPSTARVIKCAPSNLMTGMSQNRGPGGAR